VQLKDPGEIAMSRYEEDIREAIMIILGTAPGERLMRPEFGCGIHRYVFAPNNTRTASLVRFDVEEALNRWEPRIELETVTVQPDPADPTILRISIDYTVRATDSRYNLVYPFYLERGETE
jgi:phage baseplate assembly protein W